MASIPKNPTARAYNLHKWTSEIKLTTERSNVRHGLHSDRRFLGVVLSSHEKTTKSERTVIFKLNGTEDNMETIRQ